MITLQNERLRVCLAERGAEIVSVQNADGYEFIWQADPAFWGKHCPLLFPVCGRLLHFTHVYEGKAYKMGNHGFAQRKIFAARQLSGTQAEFTLHEDEETLSEYPFRFALTVRYTLEGNALTIETGVENTDNKPLYCNFGSHEAYAAGGNFTDWAVRFEKKEDFVLTEQNANGQLTGRRIPYKDDTDLLPLSWEMFANDSLLFDGLRSRKVWLEHKGERVLEVEFADFSHLLLWTKPGAPYIAIEPWNGLPDTADADGQLRHKLGILRLDPGESKAAPHTIKFLK